MAKYYNCTLFRIAKSKTPCAAAVCSVLNIVCGVLATLEVAGQARPTPRHVRRGEEVAEAGALSEKSTVL